MNCIKTLFTTAALCSFQVFAQTYKGPIIDMHIHAYGGGSSMYGMTHPPTLRRQTFDAVKDQDALKSQVLARFEKYNIVKAVVTSGSLWFDDAPDVILVADAGKTVAELRAQHKAGMLSAIAEMSPFYRGIRADDPSQRPLFALAEELGLPVGLHIFPGGPNFGFHLMPQMLGEMRAKNADPLQLDDVLVRFPKLKLYIMHGAWPYVDDVKALMYMHPQLYVDVAATNWVLPKTETYAYLKSLIDAGLGDRIMYGSDQMVWPDVMDVGIETINSAEFLSLKQKEDIFYDNAARFLELSEQEIQKHKTKSAM